MNAILRENELKSPSAVLFGGNNTVSLKVELYTPQEVAEMLRLKVSTIQRYAREGKLSGFRFGNELRFTKEDIESFISSHRLSASKKVITLKDVVEEAVFYVGSAFSPSDLLEAIYDKELGPDTNEVICLENIKQALTELVEEGSLELLAEAEKGNEGVYARPYEAKMAREAAKKHLEKLIK